MEAPRKNPRRAAQPLEKMAKGTVFAVLVVLAVRGGTIEPM